MNPPPPKQDSPSAKTVTAQNNKLDLILNKLEKLEALPESVENISIKMDNVIKKLQEPEEKLQKMEHENEKTGLVFRICCQGKRQDLFSRRNSGQDFNLSETVLFFN